MQLTARAWPPSPIPRPIEIVAIVADAYGLTSRERHVVRLLAHGPAARHRHSH